MKEETEKKNYCTKTSFPVEKAHKLVGRIQEKETNLTAS